MNIKYFIVICVVFVEVNSDCGDYITCLSDLIHNFFGTTSNKTITNDNITDLHEVKKVDNSDFEKILSDVSSLVNDEVAGDISKTKSGTGRFDSDKTSILIKVFEFDYPKGFEKVNGTTENPIFVTLSPTTETIDPNDAALTVDGITQVNNMIDSSKDFENNLILSPDAYEDLDEKNSTDESYPNIDYIELYKDATVEYVDFVPTALPTVSGDISNADKDIDNTIEYSIRVEKKSPNQLDEKTKASCHGDIPEVVFPWIAAIFIKNDSKESQFEYYCDGALLSETFVLTAARCVHISEAAAEVDNLLVVPGKRSLQYIEDNETAYRVKNIRTHSDFTLENGIATNDLTILELEEPVPFNSRVQAAQLAKKNSSASREAATTGWQSTGELAPICFNRESSCKVESNKTFCATYGYDIVTCPSYGGLYVSRQTDKWYLHGIRTGDPMVTGICIDRDISYTDVKQYTNWIENVVKDN